MTNHHLSPLSKVMDDLKKQGYASEFIFREGKLQDMGTGKTYDAAQLTVENEFRFEGRTNPDDMSILYAIKATDGTRGTISTPYGANANIEFDEFLNEASWMA